MLTLYYCYYMARRHAAHERARIYALRDAYFFLRAAEAPLCVRFFVIRYAAAFDSAHASVNISSSPDVTPMPPRLELQMPSFLPPAAPRERRLPPLPEAR